MRRASGDPVKKKKRPRPSDPLSMRGVPHNGSSSSTVTTTSALTKPVSSKLKGKLPAHSAIDTLPALDPTSPLAGMATPQVLALLAQLIPSFASTAGASPSTALANGDAPFDLSTAQGQSLVPAIRVLAQFYGVEISEAALSGTGLSRGPDDIRVDNSHDIEISPETHQSATVDTSPATKKSTVKGKAKAGAPNEQYIPIKNVDPATKVKGGIMFAEGCANCHRKKSAVWRESTNEPATGVKKQTVCNGEFASLFLGYFHSRGVLISVRLSLQLVEPSSIRMAIIEFSTTEILHPLPPLPRRVRSRLASLLPVRRICWLIKRRRSVKPQLEWAQLLIVLARLAAARPLASSDRLLVPLGSP